jgi:hypothetical protein
VRREGVKMAESNNDLTMMSQEEIDKLIQKLQEEKENQA